MEFYFTEWFIDQILQNLQMSLEKVFFFFLKKIYVLQSPFLFLCEILVYMYEWPGVYTIRTQINFHRSQEYFFQVMPFF